MNRVAVLDYARADVQESEAQSFEGLVLRGGFEVRWLSVEGFPSVAELKDALAQWSLHPHIADDALDRHDRANFEEYPEALYFDVHGIVDYDRGTLRWEKIALVLHAHGVVSVQENPKDAFTAVRSRILESKGLIRGKGPDYLFIRLIDEVLMPYYTVLDQLETAFDHLEGEVVRHPSQRIVVQVLKYKKQLAAMRRNLSPLREAVASLAKSSHPLIGRGQRPYYGDAHDKVNGLYERLEAMRSILDSLETLYVSTVSQRTNEVMRILTVFSAVFMPLTFIAGVYGMNFRWMPELNYPWAYPAVMGLMLVIAASMIIWMRWKRFW